MINKLTESAFLQYFKSPMRLVRADEEPSGLNIEGYLLAILKSEELEVGIDELEIWYVYVDANEAFEHILLSYGRADTFIAIVTNNKDTIIGYHHLKLQDKYGFGA